MHFGFAQYKQKGFAGVYILLGLIILALVAGGAYYLQSKEALPHFGKQSANSSQSSPTTYVKATPSSSISATSPSSSLDETANWKTYTNSKYGFSFKYPQDYFQYQQDESDSGIYLAPSKGNGGNGPKFLSPGDVWINANVDTYTMYSFDDYLNSIAKENPSVHVNLQKTPTTIGEVSGYKVTYNSPDMLGNIRLANYEGLVLKNNRLYKLTLSSWTQKDLDAYKGILDQILSTFKFTQ